MSVKSQIKDSGKETMSKADQDKITKKGTEQVKAPAGPDQGFVFYEE